MALMKFILEWRIKLGIKEAPTSTESEMCVKHIMDLYPDMSLEDLRLAVRYSLQGLLKVDNRAFQSFSPLYISLILNAWKAFKGHEMSKILKQKHEHETKPKEADKISKLESRRKYIVWFIEEIKKSESYIIDFRGNGYEVYCRCAASTAPPLEKYQKEAEDALQKDTRTESGTIGKILRGGDALDKYKKHFAMKEFYSSFTQQDIENLTEQQLMGE